MKNQAEILCKGPCAQSKFFQAVKVINGFSVLTEISNNSYVCLISILVIWSKANFRYCISNGMQHR
jgi:hypothetical protein